MLQKISDTSIPLIMTLMIAAAVGVMVLASCRKAGSSRGRKAVESGLILPAAAHGTLPIPPVGNAVRGKVLFAENCFMCHGKQGQGVRLVGQDLQTSRLVLSLPAAKIVAFIKHGRSATNPINHRHIAMPPYGGNPALTNQDLYDIVAYLRKLQ